ncbi:Threonine/homoserine efflux transporter RhtA [Cetobacterium ceti]|uniref:Threonine/homoserine efflux transporter RhtA n=1 Tax=Cetobacterium ceti TaxID=180163 RepID=A0A1T4LEZ0_9FUSO|nr:DMT family transporter [Cetobacterium ceti]SJZ53295.1 Threonine/homoserine efflux transporter RhtA [Cetobacterium ceti]
MNIKNNGVFLTMLSSITFGFAFTLGPLTYSLGSNPVTLTFLRNFLSLPFLIIIILVLKINLKVTKKQLLHLTILGFIGNAITTLLLNIAFALVDVGIVTPIHFTYPIFVTIGCALFFKEKFNKQKLLALIISMSGISCFFFSALGGEQSDGKETLLGLLLAVLSGVFYAFYIIYMDKSGLKNEDPFKITFYVALASTLGMFLYGNFTNKLTLGTLTNKAWVISCVFAFLCTVIALSLLQLGIKNVGPSTAAVISTFEPITSVIFGAILLGEHITFIKIIACILIFIGVLILSFSKSKEKPKIYCSSKN